MNESFLVLFFKKELLAFLGVCGRAPPLRASPAEISVPLYGRFFFLHLEGFFVIKNNMNAIASPFLSLSAVIGALRVAVAAWGGRRLLDEALVHLVHRRLGEIVRRIEGMVARFQAGRLRQVGVRVAGEPVRRKRVEAGVRLWPCRFAWLVREAGWEAAGFGCQLRAVLETPEMVAFLAACPQAKRVLMPVCRALAIETAVLGPAVKPARSDVGSEAPVPVPVPRARVLPDLGRVPIPRGVMAWVRRDRAGKRG